MLDGCAWSCAQQHLPIPTLPFFVTQARTRLVAMVDVDLLVSATLSEWMEDKSK